MLFITFTILVLKLVKLVNNITIAIIGKYK